MQRAVSGAPSAGVVTLTTIGTDFTTGAVVDVLLDTATTTGDVIFSIRRNAGGGGTDVQGRATLLVDGANYAVKKGF